MLVPVKKNRTAPHLQILEVSSSQISDTSFSEVRFQPAISVAHHLILSNTKTN